MFDPTVESALNQQINCELQAWYAYVAMSAHLDGLHLQGFAKFMELQAREEQEHAHRLIRYLLDRGGRMELQPISAPAQEFRSVRELFARAFEQERANTQSIHELYALAKDVNDYATVASLQWFLDEQVEEEKVMSEALGLLDFVGDDKSAMLTLNHQFGQRPADAGAQGSAT